MLKFATERADCRACLLISGGDDSDEEIFPWWAAVVVVIGCGVLGALILCLVCCVCRRRAHRHLEVRENNGKNSCNNNDNNPDDIQYIEMNPSKASPSPGRYSNALRPESSHTLSVKPYATIQITAADPVLLGNSNCCSSNIFLVQ